MPSKHKSIISIFTVKDVVQCHICLEVPEKSPIYQCENGHILCASCHQQLTDCPSCRVKLGRTRSLPTEQLVDLCSRPCEYEEHGCKFKVHDLNSEAHKFVCNYKPTSCMEADCDAIIPINGFANHMRVAHEVQMSETVSLPFHFTVSCDAQLYMNSDFNNNDFQMRTTGLSSGEHQFFTSIWLAHPLTDDNEKFRMRSSSDQCKTWHSSGDNTFRRAHSSGNHIGCLRKCWLIWLYIASSSSDSRRFVYTVRVKNKGDAEEYTYSGHPVPVETSREEVFHRCQCLVLAKPITDRFTKNGNFEIHFDIQKMGSD